MTAADFDGRGFDGNFRSRIQVLIPLLSSFGPVGNAMTGPYRARPQGLFAQSVLQPAVPGETACLPRARRPTPKDNTTVLSPGSRAPSAPAKLTWLGAQG